ncbi:type VII secretion protein EccB [Saccharopolyspora sp. NPDC000359]|uniref:type VII secretion protein EccB n=1 Tax=Saccharopolyspora sp. NPDC000359 TaxID=3154251 RepID=UPI003327B730
MRSRRDQVQAYFFVVGRLMSALMRGRPDEPATPARRFVANAVVGCLVAALVVVVFGVIGVVSPGANRSWQEPGAVIVEKETGAKYVYLADKLRPVLNFASARLLVNSAQGTVVSVSAKSLQDAPRGLPLGIPDAPDSLPGADALSSAPWYVCADTMHDESNTPWPVTDVQVRDLGGTPIDEDHGLLVSTPDSVTYLVWHGSRFRIQSRAVLDALGYDAVRPLPVAPSWVQALPSGPDLAAPDVQGLGGTGPAVKGVPGRIGQVYEVQNSVVGADRYYLLLSDGLAPLTRTRAALLLSDPDLAAAYPGGRPAALPVDGGAVASLPRSTQLRAAPDLPDDPPEITPVDRDARQVPCARFRVGSGDDVPTELVMVSRDQARVSGVVRSTELRGALAYRVGVPSSTGVLARELAAPRAPGGAQYVITDQGVKYPLSSDEVAGVLGYAGVPAVPVPAELLALLPTGPALDPSAAAQEHPGGPAS